MTADSPAIQIARRNSWPEVPVIAHELLTAAEGRPIVVRTLDGQNVLLRLPTPDELQQFEREARASLEQDGMVLNHPPMTRQRAEQLTAPIDPDSR